MTEKTARDEILLQQVASMIRSYQCPEIFDWAHISAIPMDFDYLLELELYLNWDIASRIQQIDARAYNHFRDRLNVREMQHNPRVTEDVLRQVLHMMDWDTVQTKQRLSVEFLNDYSGQLDNILILRYQKLPPDYIESRLTEYIKTPDMLARLLKIACEHQQMPEAFLLGLPRDILPYSTIIQHQKLSMSFLEEIMELNALSSSRSMSSAELNASSSQYQKLTPEFIIKHSEKLPGVVLLKNQHGLSPDIWGLYLNPDTAPDGILVIIGAIIAGQDYSVDIFRRLLAFGAQHVPDGVDYDAWVKNVYLAVFLRVIPGGRIPPLTWSASEIAAVVMPHIDFREVSTISMEPYQIDYLIAEFLHRIDLAQIIRYNTLTESQITRLAQSHVLTPIEWWMFLHKAATKSTYSAEFLNKHRARMKWWNYVSSIDEVHQMPHSAEFLREFERKADWVDISKNCDLPVWVMELALDISNSPETIATKFVYSQNLAGKEQFIESCLKRGIMDLDRVVAYQKTLSPKFLDAHAEYMDESTWKAILTRKDLPSWFTTKYVGTSI